jgi:hypothetical protein
MENSSYRDREIFNLGVDEVGKAYMYEIARWAKFLAIVGFIFTGLLCLGLIFLIFGASAITSQFGAATGISYGIGMMFLYVLIILIFLYPSLTLLRFANRVRPALQTANTDLFNESLKNLKNTFKFMGIYMIVMLGIYGLIILFATIAAAVAGFS